MVKILHSSSLSKSINVIVDHINDWSKSLPSCQVMVIVGHIVAATDIHVVPKFLKSKLLLIYQTRLSNSAKKKKKCVSARSH